MTVKKSKSGEYKKYSKKDSDKAYRDIMKSHGLKVGFGKRQSHSNGQRKRRK